MRLIGNKPRVHVGLGLPCRAFRRRGGLTSVTGRPGRRPAPPVPHLPRFHAFSEAGRMNTWRVSSLPATENLHITGNRRGSCGGLISYSMSLYRDAFEVLPALLCAR